MKQIYQLQFLVSLKTSNIQTAKLKIILQIYCQYNISRNFSSKKFQLKILNRKFKVLVARQIKATKNKNKNMLKINNGKFLAAKSFNFNKLNSIILLQHFYSNYDSTKNIFLLPTPCFLHLVQRNILQCNTSSKHVFTLLIY